MQRQFFGCEAQLSAMSTIGSLLKDRGPLEELIEAQQASDIPHAQIVQKDAQVTSWLL